MRKQHQHGERVEIRKTWDSETRRPVPHPQPMVEAHFCGHCGLPVVGTMDALAAHVADVCPVAKAAR